VLEKNQTGFNEKDAPPGKFLEALSDDLNTPMAIAEMHKLAEVARKGDLQAAQSLHQAGKFLGVFTEGLRSRRDLQAIGEVGRQIMPEDFQREVNSRVEA